jgi:hypothetical protein
MRAFYSVNEGKRFLSLIRRAGWEKIIENHSSRVNICARADLAAPGTALLAFRSDEPVFLAGAYGYNVKGFIHEREEKLFVLWFNSTMGIIELIKSNNHKRHLGKTRTIHYAAVKDSRSFWTVRKAVGSDRNPLGLCSPTACSFLACFLFLLQYHVYIAYHVFEKLSVTRK